MNITKTAIDGVLLIEPKVFGDARGFFMESFNQARFDAAVGETVTFHQDNHSRSAHGVLRGLHYQTGEFAQAKLVRVTQGAVLDVAVDLRLDSATFGAWVAVELTGENHQQLWIPKGCAHGFVVLSSTADFLYKASGYYAPQAEKTLLWNDVELNIDWQLSRLNTAPLLAAKDEAGHTLRAYIEGKN